jgi:Zn-dependent peptidase ImmA (M78 family)
MKTYENINWHAEQIATTISEGINEKMPSILALIRWTEDNFGIKIKINYSNYALSKIHSSGLEYLDLKDKIYKIWINANDVECRQWFTLCHEIAHIIRNSGVAYGFSAGDIYTGWGEERFCDRFAAAFLMPKELFVEKWKSFSDKDILKKARIARFFKVSGQAVYYRAKELKLIF